MFKTLVKSVNALLTLVIMVVCLTEFLLLSDKLGNFILLEWVIFGGITYLVFKEDKNE